MALNVKNKKRKGYTPRLVHDTEQRSAKSRVFHTICLILLVIMSLVSFVPLLWTVFSAFKPLGEFYATDRTFFPQKWEFDNLKILFTDYKIYKYVFNSLIVIVGNLVVQITFCATAGYVLSRLRPKGSNLLYKVILWTVMMPTTLGMIPLFMTFIDFPILHVNLMNTYIPFWIMAGADCFHIMMFKDFFDGIPISYIEAAQMDGAGKLHIFYKIVLPLSKPIIATISVFVVTASWNEYLWPLLLLKNKETYTVALAASKLMGDMPQPQILMMSLVLTIPMIIVYIISQKFIVRNDSSQGDKG